MLLDAFLDLARLLVGVDVQREIVLGGVAPIRASQPRWAGPDGVGGEADPDPAFPQVLDRFKVLGRRGLAEAGEPASRVGGVEEDEGDSRGCRGLGCCERLLKAEVVELADRGVAGGTHLPVHLLVVDADALGRLALGELEHRVAPRPEVAAALGSAPERTLEGVAMRVDEAGDREPVRHVATLSASQPVPPTSSPMRSYRAKAHVSVTKREQMPSNRSPALYP